jgi:hypothetical protein
VSLLDEKNIIGGRINVLVNGELTKYFECRVHQGDPLSPYLFILTANGLNKMIQKK